MYTKENLEFVPDIAQEANLVGTDLEIGDVILVPPYDFLALNKEKIFDLFTTDSKNHMDHDKENSALVLDILDAPKYKIQKTENSCFSSHISDVNLCGAGLWVDARSCV